MRRSNIMLLILMLVIGFASLATTLVLNGNLNISTNIDDFNIIFIRATLDGRKRNSFIDESKKEINFTTNILKNVNDESILEYEVANTSRIYDGEVSISCVVPEIDYAEIKYEPKSMIVQAGKTKTGNIKVKLTKSVVEESEISITCTLNAKAQERDTLGEEFINPYKVGGTLMKAENPEILSSAKSIWKYRGQITKVTFENQLNMHETTEELKMDVSEAQNKSVMAYAVENSETTEDNKKYDLYIQSNGIIMANKDSNSLFRGFTQLKTIEGLENFDTSNVTDMSQMFYECRKLASLDLSNFDTSNVKTMFSIFRECNNLTNLNLSKFDTNNVIDMSSMFNGCRSLTSLDLSKFDTSKVTNMGAMFSSCSSLTSLDLSEFITSKVTNIGTMFSSCSSITSLDLSKFDTSKVTNMSYMFLGCSNLNEINLSNKFVTNNVNSMLGMFFGCRSLKEIDLSSFNTGIVTSMESMFNGCSSLTELDLSNFVTSNLTNTYQMFDGCRNLTNLDISHFDISKVTKFTYVFRYMPTNATVLVKDETVQTWVLNLNTSYNRPSSWIKENNVKVKV